MRRQINASAIVHETTRGVVDLSSILDLNACSASRDETSGIDGLQKLLSTARLDDPDSNCGENLKHDPAEDEAHWHKHDIQNMAISTLAITLPGPLSWTQRVRLDEAIQGLLWNGRLEDDDSTVEILRTKGIFWAAVSEKEDAPIMEYIVQGVREIYEIKAVPGSETQYKDEQDGRYSGKLVLIGKGLRGSNIEVGIVTLLV